VASGVVAAQTPAGGNKVAKGTNITVTVSLGKEETKVLVPSLMGLTEMDATMKAIEAGLEISSVTEVFNSEYEEGTVCYQSFSNGSWVDPGTGIDIKVSKGEETLTYKCNTSIAAPTTEEAPDYSGGDVKLKLVADDGTVLLDTTVSSFPQSVNSFGLNSSGGTLTMTYTVTTTEKDADGNVVATVENEKTVTRRIEFTVE
jgi:serine/threonine-protein kinase